MSFQDALTTAVLPVLSIAAAGYLLGQWKVVDAEPLSTATIYVLAPALVFHSLATTQLQGRQIVTIAVGVGVFTAAMAVLGEATGRLLGKTGPELSGLTLSSTFSNCGNYGIPLCAFAFGPVGRSTAVLYLVSQNVFMYTIGVYLASRNSSDRNRGAVMEIFRLPLVYALFAAIAARQFGLLPPADSVFMSTIELTGNAAIPVMLLLLGLQLAYTDHEETVRRMVAPNVLRIGVAPVVGVGVVFALGITSPVVARTFVLESALPVAITPLMLAIEYDDGTGEISAPSYMSSAIFTTTVISIPTVALLITILKSGVVV